MNGKKTLRTCSNGHKYYKSSDCPVCPVCDAENKPADGFLSSLAAPARRALQNINIKIINDLSAYTEADIRNLHGIGPSSIPKLKAALEQAGLSFKNES